MAFFNACHLLLLLISNFFISQLRADDDPDAWSYSSPDKWPQLCATGRRQSPIGIDTSSMTYDKSLSNLRFINFNFNVNGTLANPGNRGIRWTVDLPDEDPKLPKVVGGGLSGDYFIRYVDFRWSASDCEGSDHYIDYKPSPLEIQLVTYRSFSDIDDADTSSIAIFSWMFYYGEKNPNFDPLFQGVNRVLYAAPFSLTLQTTLPPLVTTPQYYRYNGSLSTPPCTENVEWTIFAQKQSISREQMSFFRRVQSLSGWPVNAAFRPLQPISGRRVVTNARMAATYEAVPSTTTASPAVVEDIDFSDDNTTDIKITVDVNVSVKGRGFLTKQITIPIKFPL